MAIFKRLLAAPSEADGADLKLRIPEMLIGRPKKGNFILKVDSLLKEAYSLEHIKEWAKYRQDCKVPANSEESGEEKPIIPSEDSEEEEIRMEAKEGEHDEA